MNTFEIEVEARWRKEWNELQDALAEPPTAATAINERLKAHEAFLRTLPAMPPATRPHYPKQREKTQAELEAAWRKRHGHKSRRPGGRP